MLEPVQASQEGSLPRGAAAASAQSPVFSPGGQALVNFLSRHSRHCPRGLSQDMGTLCARSLKNHQKVNSMGSEIYYSYLCANLNGISFVISSSSSKKRALQCIRWRHCINLSKKNEPPFCLHL